MCEGQSELLELVTSASIARRYSECAQVSAMKCMQKCKKCRSAEVQKCKCIPPCSVVEQVPIKIGGCVVEARRSCRS